MNQNTNISLTVEAWADIVLKEWFNKIRALNINSTGPLVESFQNTVYSAANGDPEKVRFMLEYYYKMVDYGVGKGVNLADRDGMIAAGLTKRRPKPFFTDVFYKQLAVLRHLLEDKYALKAEELIVRKLSDNADLGNNE